MIMSKVLKVHIPLKSIAMDFDEQFQTIKIQTRVMISFLEKTSNWIQCPFEIKPLNS